MKKILIVCSGMSPQVLTETLYALVTGESGRFVPDEVHLISTASGAKQARLNLLEGNRHYLRFCHDYGFEAAAFGPERIHVIRDRLGRPLDDIRTPDDNAAMADYVMNFVRTMTNDPGCVIHMSMAGGRKTMGYYCGYAMSLFGRAQDALSHVLVSDGFEGNPDFYYPTPAPATIHDRDKKALDASEAVVSLAEIPFVRLRESLPREKLVLDSGFTETVNCSQLAIQPPMLRYEADSRALFCSGIRVDMGMPCLALYLWLLKHGPILRSDLDGGVLSKAYARSFIAEYKALTGAMRAQDRVIEAQQHGLLEGYFESNRSELNKALREQLGSQLARVYEIKSLGKRGSTSYQIALSPEQIEGL